MTPIFVEPGDAVIFTVILDPSSEDTVDWSFTAWGTEGPVSVTNRNSAITSDSYPTSETPRSIPSELEFN